MVRACDGRATPLRPPGVAMEFSSCDRRFTPRLRRPVIALSRKQFGNVPEWVTSDELLRYLSFAC